MEREEGGGIGMENTCKPMAVSFQCMTKSTTIKKKKKKNPPADARNIGLIPRSGRSPGEENGNPLQYSCPKNSMGRAVRWAAVHGAAKS